MRHAYAFPRTLSVTEYSALARSIVGQHRIYWNMYAGYTVVCMHIASEAAMRGSIENIGLRCASLAHTQVRSALQHR